MAIFLDDAPHVAGTVITLTTLAYLTFGLRVYCRVTRQSWGIEDWLMTAAAFPFAMLSIACLVSSFNGIGIHAWRLDQDENQKYKKQGLFWFFLFEVFYCVSIIPIKLSISFMLVRIAQNRKIYVYSQYGMMGIFTTMNLIAALYIIFQCNPVAAAWDTDLLIKGGKCNDPVILADIYYATTAVNIVTDWFTALLPIPLLWNVKLNLNAKLSVAAILGLGVFASLSACIRLKYTVNLTNSNDYLFGLSNIVIWGYAENGTGMFVGCVATLRPLFRRALNLGGSDTKSFGGPSAQKTPNGFPSQSRRTYFKSGDTSYEMSTVNSTREKKGPLTSITTGGQDEMTSISSEEENKVDFQKDGVLCSLSGILVSRQVNITHT
ncbi:uncharacterized protein BCR38DRAFT_436705 [Pseudomassariella vexata]|uniref:Rhodopsin domain-containing protein n=1 Tax=Pseudomassariella vexata TaxID=1141098 RepID=A0A1Y2DW74_9PEZI|nr:uncharacterized protein BCR38DRAFT_436705 [Pseudomassariella vexata]ORY63386.1 hypothetical protein BCR38DRAFT_436705 [Pseudomassariella vexata]